jgi:hypothetical protein
LSRGEELLTYDEDFEEISAAAERLGLFMRIHKP